MPVQWVHLGRGGVLIASSRGAWLQPAGLDTLALGGAMPSSLPATPETTRHLLDGAIVAGERSSPVADVPPLTPRRWAWDLVNQWYVASQSIALLEEAQRRFAELGRDDLADFTAERLDGERGHDQFPLDDLRALGYEAERAVREVPPAGAARALIEYAAQCVGGDSPVEFLGYIHATERQVIRLPPEWFVELASVLPTGTDAASGLRAHAGELDIDHVEEAINFIAGLPAPDRARVALGCYRTTVIRNASTDIPDPSEAELEAWLSPLQRQDQPSKQGALP